MVPLIVFDWYHIVPEAGQKQHLDVNWPIASDPTRDLDYVMNMDQMPMFHAMDFKSMIDMVGACTVNLHTAASDSNKHVTVAVTITASGRSVKSMVVFRRGKSFIDNYFFSKVLHLTIVLCQML